MVIAIDGPAGSGKSTVARLVAERLGVSFLNSGSFYRGITLCVIRAGIKHHDERAVLSLAESLSLGYFDSRLTINGEDVEDLLHSDEIDALVSQVSEIVPLRHLVNEKISGIAKFRSIVCEGRDMTTVVFPDADYKFYLDASIDVQAERRYKQGVSSLSLDEIRESIRARDENDKKKEEGALKIVKNAIYIDTSRLTIEEVCEIILSKITIQGLSMAKTDVVKNEVQESPDNIQTQLQEEYFKSFESLEEGQLVEGKVVQLTPDQVFVDVGYKSEGKIPANEFKELPQIGNTVNVVLIAKEGKHGEVIVSKQRAELRQLWKNLRQAVQDKTPISGKIAKVVRGGYDVDLGGGIFAFLPQSRAGIQKVEKPESLVGLTSDFYIERLYSDNKANIVVNRKKCLEDTVEKKRSKFFETAVIGDTVKGVVKSFTSFGAFIDLGGFDGLLHINDMSWGHVMRPREFVRKGQEIELKLIRLEPDEKRINLSLKHLVEDPWLHFEEKYHVGDVVQGKVTKLADFGAFIELEDGIEGLAHISEFSWVKKVNRPSDMVKAGDEVECMVLGYDIQAGRVSLGLKQVTDNPLDTLSENYPVGMKLTRKVVKLTNAGAFIQLEDGIDGFLHADDISWTKKVRYPGSELTVGQEVETIVVENNPDERRVHLSIKHLSEDPWIKFMADHKPGSVLEGEIVSITDFGVFVKAPGGIEGLVNKANLTASREETFEDAVKKYKTGDKITVFVVEVSPSKQKAAFSVREVKAKQQRDELAQYMSSAKDEDEDSFTLGDFLKNKSN
jgi:small subunit ribosomal protein S1